MTRRLFQSTLLSTCLLIASLSRGATEVTGFQIPKLSRHVKKQTVQKYIDGDRMLDKVQEIPEILSDNKVFLKNADAIKALQQKEDECLPNCEHGYFTSVFRGAKLHYRRFLPEGKPKGVVVWMHGITSFSGVAFDVNGRKINMALMSETLTKQGYAVYAFDLYGHGFSEGVRHYVKNWKNNFEDYKNFVQLVSQQHDEEMPLFLMGESYGGCLTLHVARHFQEHPEEAPKGFDSIMLLAPAIQADMPPYPVYFALRYGLAPLFPRWIPFFMPHPVSNDRIWRDQDVAALHDEEVEQGISLGGGGKPFRLGTATSLIKALKAVREKTIPKLKVPFAVVHGEQDHAIPMEGTDFLLEHAQTPQEDRAVLKLKGAYHDLLSDPDAEKTMSFVTNWISKRLERRGLADSDVEEETTEATLEETPVMASA